ncbi:MAG TPA: chromosome partitioning protein ParB [Clostridiales bacterium]|nr:chromosome partitioning protein ParB [Clostridiales bacterium]
MPRRGLGRGLDALLPGASEAELQELPVGALRPSRFQPREAFDEGRLEELANSIRQHGVVQPIVARRSGDGYEVVVGERRWRATVLAGLETIPALVRDFSDAGAMELALIENLQREDLNPMEEATAYRRLIEEFRFTQETVAERVGRERTHVAHCLRLLGLEPEVQEALRRGELSLGHGKVLAGVSNREAQRRLAGKVREGALSVRALELLVGRTPGRRKTSPAGPGDPTLQSLEERLARRLGTRVRIRPARTGGRIEILYFGPSELQRLLEGLLGEDAVL